MREATEVASFGENLRRAREARNMTLQEIAASTKISTRALQALEDERFELLPGGIFNKGFVRSYARAVGLDEEKAVAEYLAAAMVPTPELDMHALSSQVEAAAPPQSNSGPTARTFVTVLAVLVGLGLGALWLREQRRESLEQAAQQRAQSAVVSAPAPIVPSPPPVVVPSDQAAPATAQQTPTNATPASAPAASSTSSAPSQPAPQPATQPATQPAKPPSTAAAPASKSGSAPVEISIVATHRAWISVRSDGKPVETLTLDPDKPEVSTRTYSAKERLLLVVGNPAGITVTYNGKPAGSLGPEGQRAMITFTPEGIEKQ
jgi:cytoskeletal protein RodZ